VLECHIKKSHCLSYGKRGKKTKGQKAGPLDTRESTKKHADDKKGEPAVEKVWGEKMLELFGGKGEKKPLKEKTSLSPIGIKSRAHRDRAEEKHLFFAKAECFYKLL